MERLKLGPSIISILVVVGFIAVLALMLIHPVTVDNGAADIIKILVGSLGAKFGDVVQYHIGDTAASKEKTTMVRDLALQTPPPPDAPPVSIPSPDAVTVAAAAPARPPLVKNPHAAG